MCVSDSSLGLVKFGEKKATLESMDIPLNESMGVWMDWVEGGEGRKADGEADREADGEPGCKGLLKPV